MRVAAVLESKIAAVNCVSINSVHRKCTVKVFPVTLAVPLADLLALAAE